VKKRDEEWGFEAGKGGMAVEAKMGMAVIVILVCAFGFLVYHKFDLKQRALLQANIEGKNAAQAGPTELAPASAMLEVQETNPDSGAWRAVDETPSTVAASVADSTAPQQDAPLFDLSEPTSPPYDVTADQSSAMVASDDVIPTPQPTEDPFAVLATKNSAREETTPQPFPTTAEPSKPFQSEQTLASNMSAPDQSDPFAAAATTEAQPSAPLFPSFDAADETPPSRDVAVADPKQNSAPVKTDDVAMGDLFPSFDAAEETPAPSAQPEETTVAKVQGLPPAASVSRSRELPPLPTAPEPAFDTLDNEATALPSFAGSDEPAQPTLQDSPMVAFAEPKPDVNLFEEAAATSAAKTEASPTSDKTLSVERPALVVTPDPTPMKIDPDPQPYQRSEPASDTRQFGGDNRFDRDTQTQTLVQTSPSQSQDATPTTASQPKTAADENSMASDPAFMFAPVEIPSDEPAPLPTAAPQPQFGMAQYAYENGIRQVAASSEDCDICVVKHNDNYWTISKRMYGTARYFSALALFNQHRIKDPKKIRPGMKVLIPDPKRLEEKYPELFREFQQKETKPPGYFLQKDGKPAYRVGEKETLSEISQKHLGRASRWMEIYRMNQQRMTDPNRLKPGTVLALPDDATAVNIAP